jgi:acetyl-CoA/propionyl-CoA carboxylase biotin carboxyl carrier protein
VSLTGIPTHAQVTVGDRDPVEASAIATEDGFRLTCAGRTTSVVTAADATGACWLWLDGAVHSLKELPALRRGAAAGGPASGDVRSPMPGAVVAVQVTPGQLVRKGAPLLVVEAMKMEHTLVAPFDGTVEEVTVRLGAQVRVDQTLARLTTTTAPEGAVEPA